MRRTQCPLSAIASAAAFVAAFFELPVRLYSLSLSSFPTDHGQATSITDGADTYRLPDARVICRNVSQPKVSYGPPHNSRTKVYLEYIGTSVYEQAR